MTTQPTQRQLQALQALRNNDDVVEYLQGLLDESTAKLVGIRDVEDFRVCQGHAQAYQKLIDTILGTTPRRSGKR